MAKPATHCKRGHEFTPENTRWIQTRSRNTPYKRCKTCERVWTVRLKPYMRDYSRTHLYGLTRAAWSAMLVEQDGLCAICYDRPAVAVDHDHETGQVRGLLCKGCNVALGVLGDNEESIRRVLDYVSTPRMQEVV